MVTFTGTFGNDSADASTGTLVGFTGGTVAQLQDAIGDRFIGGFNIDTIVGGSGNDTVVVNNGEFPDNYNGQGGNDVLDLSGLTTNVALVDLAAGTYDTFIGAGPRTITSVEMVIGGAGNDTLIGGSGFETIMGGGGNDSLRGGFNVDSLNGGAGNDTLTMLEGEFIDDIDGGAGVDLLDLSNLTTRGATINMGANSWDLSPAFPGPQTILGVENVIGTQTDDTILGNAAANNFTGGGGDDSLSGAGGNDTLLAGSGFDTLNGGDGNDSMQGGFTTDTVSGGLGNDTLTILDGEFVDQFDGGGGNGDTADLSSFDTEAVTVNLLAGTWSVATLNSSTIVNVEHVIGGSANDSLSGNNGNNRLTGNVGNDSLVGNGGNDTLLGGIGFDTLLGGAGNDSMQGGFERDSVNGGIGNDTLTVLDGEFVDDFDGGTGTDRVDLTAVTASVFVDLGAGTWSVSGLNSATLANVENATGGSNADNLTGSAGNNRLDGSFGGDFLDSGGAGNDTLLGGSGSDTILGGSGNDLMQGGFFSDTVTGNGGNDTLQILEGEFIDQFDGTAGIDTLDLSNITSRGANVNLLGFTWDLSPSFGGPQAIVATEVVIGTQVNDTIFGSTGADTLRGGLGADNLTGNGQNDSLDGGDGNDTLIGNTGNDTLVGGNLNDTMTGGANNDTFTYSKTNDADRITDMAAGAGVVDIIRLLGFGTAFDTFAEVMAATTNIGGNAVINFGGGDTLTIAGVLKAQLNADDFTFI